MRQIGLLKVILPLLLVALFCVACGNKGTDPTETSGAPGEGGNVEAGWRIVIGDEAAGAGEKLRSAVEGAYAPPEGWSSRLILVGNTGDEASEAAALGLRENDYAVQFGKEKIVILGGSPEKTAEAVDWVCEQYAAYVTENGDLPFGRDYDRLSVGTYGSAATQHLTLGGISIDRFVISAEGGEKNAAAKFLQETIQNMTDARLAIVEPAADGDYRIELASGGRGNSGGLKQEQYCIRQEGGTLWLCADASEHEMVVTKMFTMKYLSYDLMNSMSNLNTIELEDLNFAFTCNWDEFTAPEVVQTRIMTIPPEDGYSVLQGGTSDGKYGYFIMNNQSYNPYINKIYKVDLDTWTVVKVSGVLDLQHANSITYNEKLGKLIAVKYDPDMYVLSYVDPETLTVTGTKTVEFKALSLAYSAERDAYVAGTRGTFDFFILDKNFKVTDYCEGVQTTSVKQEVVIHKDRILFTMSGANITYVYDWDGNFLYAFDQGTFLEAENTIFHGDFAYFGYYSGGGHFYEGLVYQVME